MPHDRPGTLKFSDAKDHGQIRTGSLLRGQQMQVGGLKLATFDKWLAITRKQYKIDVWFLLKSNIEVVCALSNGYAADGYAGSI